MPRNSPGMIQKTQLLEYAVCPALCYFLCLLRSAALLLPEAHLELIPADAAATTAPDAPRNATEPLVSAAPAPARRSRLLGPLCGKLPWPTPCTAAHARTQTPAAVRCRRRRAIERRARATAARTGTSAGSPIASARQFPRALSVLGLLERRTGHRSTAGSRLQRPTSPPEGRVSGPPCACTSRRSS
ncbi:hypothetical protein DFH27DRAFT_628463 [Peziza echinospora]|nr:hypothetical protein DFH27DRAFT_628463 [Peziza echinospora]